MRSERKKIKIRDRLVGEGYPTLVIAEIGNNHDGKVSQAKKLIKDAYEAGCDIVKFQTHIAYEEMIDDGATPPHFKEPRYKFTQRMQLSKKDHIILKKYAENLGLIFLSSPFSEKAVDLLEEIGVSAFKIASGELTNIPFLHYVAKKKKTIIMSTGMSSWEEIDRAVSAIRKYNNKLILMQCTSQYPCPYEKVGLGVIWALKKRYDCPVGISDHTPTNYTAFAAVTLGACIIEKHFTIDKSLYGPDHKASLVKEEMRSLIEGVRAIETALKPFDKNTLRSLGAVRDTFQKSLVAKRDIPAHTKITRTFICQKKPGTGISPVLIDTIVGKVSRVKIRKNTLLHINQFK
ncbi:MAG: N-acetylneuraminate synthase family protein [Candidatus Omnitrophica bacterium]|jgi:sialic acid synthase SpsE|nr:N-acetylneuraminate synthase family protein [Candidatus Omnitrophota bacterium]